MKEAVKLLDETLTEEISTDRKLTDVADKDVNDHARQAA